MAGEIQIRGISRVVAKLEGIRAFRGSQLLMDEIGRGIVERILERTGKGVDVIGAEFDPYSTSYKKRREDLDLPVDDVDLFFSGSMLGALTWEASKKQVRIFFQDTPGTSIGGVKPTATNAEKALYNQDKRDFFGMSSNDTVWATNLAQQWVKTLLG